MSWHDALAGFGRSTEPSAKQIASAKQRLGLGDQAGISRRLLQSLDEPGEGAEARVRARVQLTPIQRENPATTRLAVGLTLAAAASWAFVLWPSADRPVALQLEPASSSVALGELVRLTSAGIGSAGGTELRPHVEWKSGRLDVEVEPHSGVQMSVDTPEGTVRVIGTVFSVQRDVMGTTVGVTRGEVEVQCAGAESTRITQGQTALCQPTTAGGRLGRARALAAQGAGAEVVLSALDAASSLAPAGPAAGEILALRFDTLRSSGRASEALSVADQYRREGHSERSADVCGAAAVLAFEQGGCGAAKAWLADADNATAAELLLRCRDDGSR